MKGMATVQTEVDNVLRFLKDVFRIGHIFETLTYNIFWNHIPL